MTNDPYGPEAIKQILMRRDDCTEAEAGERLEECILELEACVEGYEDGEEFACIVDLEEVVRDHLGLEPDYLMGILPI